VHRTDGAAVNNEVIDVGLTGANVYELLATIEHEADPWDSILSELVGRTRVTVGVGRNSFEQSFEIRSETSEQ
jgi:hypothetical protein